MRRKSGMMNNRTLCLRIDGAALYFARPNDMRLVYDMMHGDEEIKSILFYGESEDWDFEKYQETERKWFPGHESRNSYYLIESSDEIVGWISHSYNSAKIENMEVDIAFNSLRHAGKGLGTKIILALTDYTHKKYGINTFMIRPGKHNERAIRAYEKSGFKPIVSFDPGDYYTAEDALLWGDGDCGAEGTLNMVKIYD
jgi:RimJ/RimL family protein N-acetyltransferase